MDLKTILKNGKKLLAAGQFGEAYSLLKGAVDEGQEDYLLFCLLALAASNNEKSEEAVQLYGRAIQVDGKSLTAWQGLNKMYSTGQVKVDERALDAVEILLKESDELKKDSLMKDKRRYLIELRKWNSLTKEDLESERECIPKILESIVSEEKELTTDNRNLCTLCFVILGDDLTSETALRRAIFMYKSGSYSSWSVCVYDSRVNGDNVWIREKRRLAMAIQYMMDGEINEKCRELVQGTTQDTLFQFLFAIDEGDSISASEILDSRKSVDTPLSIASLQFLIKDEEYEVALNRIESLKPKFEHDLEVSEFMRGLEAECMLRSGEHVTALTLIPLPKPSFALMEARIIMENDKEVDSELMGTLDKVDALRLEVRGLLKHGYKTEAEGKCTGLDREAWEDVLLEAECSSPSKAMSLLVKAAKMNPRCSRAFYLLATILRGKNRVKAISLAERATSIRRGNEEYARLLDELMCENGEAEEKRLKCIHRFVDQSSSVPEWARISISRLLINCNRVDDALFYLQEGIGETSSPMRWALLGEAYALRGQLSSSINAYEESLRKEHNLHHVVSMLGVSLRLGDFLRTMTLCNEWMDEAKESSVRTPILLILSQCILAICNEDISTHLPTLFTHITELFPMAAPSSILYKLFGDSLLLLSRTTDTLFTSITTPSQWNVKDGLSCLRLSSHFYSRCVGMRREEGSYWSDLSLSLYLLWKMEKDTEALERARKCIVQSIQVSGGKGKSYRSKLWTYLAMMEEARGEGAVRIKHCLSRSIQLDCRNDFAWLRLAVLFFHEKELTAACEAVENCTKWNPLQCEGWSLWGELAMQWSGGSDDKQRTEGEEMIRHAISLNPTVWAVTKFAHMVCDRLVKGEKWSPARLHIDFKKMLQLKYYSCLSSSEDLLRLGVLAELCGCYEEAKEILESTGHSIHKERNELKYACLPSSSTHSSMHKDLLPLYKLCKESSEKLKELVEASECVVNPGMKETVVVREEEGEGEEKKERVVRTVYPSLRGDSIPLLVSAIITFGFDLGDEFISALHDLSPRDELIDYFPTVVPEEVDNGILFIAKDGEKPYRVHNEVASDLLEIIKKRRLTLTAA